MHAYHDSCEGQIDVPLFLYNHGKNPNHFAISILHSITNASSFPPLSELKSHYNLMASRLCIPCKPKFSEALVS